MDASPKLAEHPVRATRTQAAPARVVRTANNMYTISLWGNTDADHVVTLQFRILMRQARSTLKVSSDISLTVLRPYPGEPLPPALTGVV
ncbi:hypothetical protein GCM10029976_046890 [Kribbella albertanoniae]